MTADGALRDPTWRRMPRIVRTLGFWLMVVQLVGYSTGLLFVYHTTGLTPPGAAAQYRGTDSIASAGAEEDDEAAMKFPKSYPEMLNITHTHLLSMAAIFAVSGLALALCERPAERWRRVLVAEPFVALLVSFSAMWLMRYVDARFGWLLAASSGLMALTFYAQSLLVLRELRALRRLP